MKLSRTRVLLVAATAPIALVMATTAPASASAPSALVLAVTGGGSISPGLTAVPQPQTFSFSGTALVTGVEHGNPVAAAPRSISASGSDLAGSYAAGAGPITVNLQNQASQSGYFVRVGAVVAVAVVGPLASAGAGVCAFEARQLPPATVTSYDVVCGAVASWSQ